MFVDAQRAIDLYGYNVAMNKVSGEGSLSAGLGTSAKTTETVSQTTTNTGEPEGAARRLPRD